MTHRYTFENAWYGARRRLTGIEDMADPGTIRHLEACEIDDGWECLEAGAGGGSIAGWLCEHVGSEGRVVATDVDTRFLEELDMPNLEVRQHDIVTDALPAAAFDLVHARALIAHQAAPQQALERMVATVKPGGMLLVEELDFLSVVPGPAGRADDGALFERMMEAHNQVLSARFDPFYGRRLLNDLRNQPLADLDAEGRTIMINGGSPGAEAFQLTFDQLREPLEASGLVSERDINDAIDLLDDPDWEFMSMVIMAVRGRKREAA